MVLGTEVYPKMLRKMSKAVPEGNGPISLLGGILLEELRRVMYETMGKAFGEITKDVRKTNQRLTSLEQDAWQPRLTMEAEVKANEKTCERTEVATAVVQAKYGDSWSAKSVQAGPKGSTSLGDAGPPAFPCSRDDVLVGNGVAAPKSCLSHLEMRTPTAAGGLFPACTTSTATRTTFD